MTAPRFRNPDRFEVRHEREFIRQHCPSGRDGFIAKDLDLVTRAWGPRFETDGWGRLRLEEIKFGRTPLGQSKVRTFGLLDRLCRAGAAALGEPWRYDGFYVVRYGAPTWAEADWFVVNDIELTPNEFVRWLKFDPLRVPAWRSA